MFWFRLKKSFSILTEVFKPSFWTESTNEHWQHHEGVVIALFFLFLFCLITVFLIPVSDTEALKNAHIGLLFVISLSFTFLLLLTDFVHIFFKIKNKMNEIMFDSFIEKVKVIEVVNANIIEEAKYLPKELKNELGEVYGEVIDKEKTLSFNEALNYASKIFGKTAFIVTDKGKEFKISKELEKIYKRIFKDKYGKNIKYFIPVGEEEFIKDLNKTYKILNQIKPEKPVKVKFLNVLADEDIYRKFPGEAKEFTAEVLLEPVKYLKEEK